MGAARRALKDRREVLRRMVDALANALPDATGVIPWSSPVIAFGDPSEARVATVGLNPSSHEFLGLDGNELTGARRRFHTLSSLNLSAWGHARAEHIRSIDEACCAYFARNPYERWFGRLEQLLSFTGASYYGGMFATGACHLDLSPYATLPKWSELAPSQRSALLYLSRSMLADVVRSSSVDTLILNGRTVVEHFETVSGVTLDRQPMSRWALPRAKGEAVAGFRYCGRVSELGGAALGREILVLGYNHNIQSSYGVTRDVILSIGRWLGQRVNAAGRAT